MASTSREEAKVPQPSLLQRIRVACRDREFTTIEDLAAQPPDVSYEAIETTVIGAVRRGLLGGRFNKTELADGNILIVSGIRG